MLYLIECNRYFLTSKQADKIKRLKKIFFHQNVRKMNVNTFNKCRDLIRINSQQNERLKHKWSINTWKLYEVK